MRIRFRRSAVCLLLLAGSALACSSPKTESAPSEVEAAPAQAAGLPGLDRPVWATPDRFSGRLDANATIRVQVHLQQRDVEGARTDLAERSDPASAKYGHFLTDGEFEARYAPTEADVAAVRAHLEKNGLRVTAAPSNRAFLAAEGSTAQVERAFSTRLGTYVVKGVSRRAPVDVASLPADIAPRVAAVLGLATPRRAKPAMVIPRGARAAAVAKKANGGVPPDGCSNYWGQYEDTIDPPFGGGFERHEPYGLCSGYVPAQIRKMYGFDAAVRAGNDGSGQTIALVDAWESPTLLQDVQQYVANNDPGYPLPASRLTQQSPPGAFESPPDQGWYSEETLDVEAAHALAPKATIAIAAALSNGDDDLVGALNLIITSHLANLASCSWGFEEKTESQASFTAYEQVILEGSLKGIGFFFATGDSGDNAFDDKLDGVPGVPPGPSASFPSSLPEVTAVGGTAVALGKGDTRVFELGWETGASLLLPAGFEGSWEDYLDGNLVPPSVDAGAASAWWPAAPGGFVGSGGGGGPSMQYAQPAYQRGTVPASLARDGAGTNAKARRVLPDVAMLADPSTGFQVGLTFEDEYLEFPSGGTSLAAPLFVASVALAQQASGRHFGFLNPLLYATPGALRDVRPTFPAQSAVIPLDPVNLVTFDYHGPENSLATAPGYDDVTGLGTPNGAAFISALGRR